MRSFLFSSKVKRTGAKKVAETAHLLYRRSPFRLLFCVSRNSETAPFIAPLLLPLGCTLFYAKMRPLLCAARGSILHLKVAFVQILSCLCIDFPPWQCYTDAVLKRFVLFYRRLALLYYKIDFNQLLRVRSLGFEHLCDKRLHLTRTVCEYVL